MGNVVDIKDIAIIIWQSMYSSNNELNDMECEQNEWNAYESDASICAWSTNKDWISSCVGFYEMVSVPWSDGIGLVSAIPNDWTDFVVQVGHNSISCSQI